jgi:hypothetical protein
MKRHTGELRPRAIPLALAKRPVAELLAAALITIVVLLAAAMLLSLTSCGGGSSVTPADDTVNGAPMAMRATAADFTMEIQPETYRVSDHFDDIVMSVDDQGETVTVRFDILGAIEMHAFVTTLDFDPQLFDPISLRLGDLENPERGLIFPDQLPGAKEYGRYWLVENRT